MLVLISLSGRVDEGLNRSRSYKPAITVLFLSPLPQEDSISDTAIQLICAQLYCPGDGERPPVHHMIKSVYRDSQFYSPARCLLSQPADKDSPSPSLPLRCFNITNQLQRYNSPTTGRNETSCLRPRKRKEKLLRCFVQSCVQQPQGSERGLLMGRCCRAQTGTVMWPLGGRSSALAHFLSIISNFRARAQAESQDLFRRWKYSRPSSFCSYGFCSS